MPFELSNTPSAFQYLMNNIFYDLLDVCVVIYSDDEESHKRHIQTVLERLRKNNLRVRPEKCEFHTTQVEYLGVIVSPDGVSMDPRKVQTIIDWPVPQNVKELQSFLGFANFYRCFIDNYSGITKELTTLLKKDSTFRWTIQCQEVFDLLKTAFCKDCIIKDSIYVCLLVALDPCI
jgi:hypothetical protein